MCVLAALAVSGCSSGPADKYVTKPAPTVPQATVAPGDEATLLPLDKGNEWIYTIQVVRKSNGADLPPISYESKWTVTDSKQTPKGVEATIETTGDKGTIVHQKWLANSKGIYQLADGNPQLPFDPPYPVVLFPVKPDSSFSWKGTGPNGTAKAGPISSDRTILAPQVVDTDMGQMSAFPVTCSETIQANGKTAKSDSTVWLDPGVGIVRLYQVVDVGNQSGYALLIKLKSKSLMKS